MNTCNAEPTVLPILDTSAVVIIPAECWPDWLLRAFAADEEDNGPLFDPREVLLLPAGNGGLAGREDARARLEQAATDLFDYGTPWRHFDAMDSHGQLWRVCVLSDS